MSHFSNTTVPHRKDVIGKASAWESIQEEALGKVLQKWQSRSNNFWRLM